MIAKIFTGFRLPEVMIYFCLLAFGAASVNALEDLSPSDCLTEPLRGLVYKYTGIVAGSNGVKTGCYAMYGDGTQDYDQIAYSPEPVQYRQYFVIDATGSEIPLSSDGRVNISISSGTQSKANVTFEMGDICFPQKCYTLRDEYSRSCRLPFSGCGSLSERRTKLGKVSTYDSKLFCSAGNPEERIAFSPHDANVTFPEKVPDDSGPYLRYFYSADTPRGKHFGCEIVRPLNSNKAFRTFFFFDKNNDKISVNKDGMLINKPSDEGGSLGDSIKNLCFPANCFSSLEDQHCESAIKKTYPESAYGIILHTTKYKEPTVLLGRTQSQCN